MLPENQFFLCFLFYKYLLKKYKKYIIMSFSIEDQYQQFLYPDAMDYMANERNGNVSVYQDYSSPPPQPDRGYSTGASQQTQTRNALPPNAIKILILNAPSKLNKRLIKFFMSNLEYMNTKGMFFDWIVVYEDEMEHYEEQNITEFPMLITEREKIAGASSIISKLQSMISGTKRASSSYASGNDPDGELRNYFLKELDNKQDDEVDDNDMFKNTLTERIAAMNKTRQASGQHAVKTTNPEIHERMARSASSNNNYNFDDRTRGGFDPHRYTRHTQPPVAAGRTDNLEYVPPEETPRNEAPSAADIARYTSNGSIDDQLMMNYWENQETTDMFDY